MNFLAAFACFAPPRLNWWTLWLIAIAAAVSPAVADAPWHAAQHSHRAIVEVRGGGSEAVDVARVRIRHTGLARPDANDYRIFDERDEPVPYQVTFHDPQRDTLISFRSPRGQGNYYIYFGHGEAQTDPHRALLDGRPGAGPPQPGPAADGWIPKAGLVLATYRRPSDVPNPETVDEFAALLASADEPDGAAYRPNISDGFNPFGFSDDYISVYRGWLRLPDAGTWGFATASNEASFSFIDGHELVHWPGRHTEQRGERGERNAEHSLDAGLHYVEYYQEEVALYQLAFLGYKPPGAPHYVGIRDELFVRPHDAEVVRYDRRDEAGTMRQTTMPRIELIDSVWPSERGLGQYTRYRFDADHVAVGVGGGWQVTWDFGDGQRGFGGPVEHVYLAANDYEVTLRATSPMGEQVTRTWPVTVFPIEHIDGPFEQGRYADHLPIVSRYDAAALDDASLIELVRFLAEAGPAGAAAEAVKQLAGRDSAPAADRAEAALAAAGDAGLPHDLWRRRDGAAARDAAAQLAAAAELAEAAPEKLAAMARLIRVRGVHEQDVDAARELYAQAEQLVRQAGVRGRAKQMFRDATLAVGDVHLLAGEHDQARQDYRTAEALAEPVIPQQVRVARVGALPQRIEHHLAEGDFDAAWGTAMRWYADFPSDMLRGELAMWIGKVAMARGEHDLAVRPLRLAVERGEGAMWEAEARWLLAEAHGKRGDEPARRATLEALLRTGLTGPYRERARAALDD